MRVPCLSAPEGTGLAIDGARSNICIYIYIYMYVQVCLYVRSMTMAYIVYASIRI